MPVGVLEMNPAKPHPALSTTPLSGSFASYMLLRNSLAEPLFRLLRKLFHHDLPQIGSPGFMRLMIPQAVDTFELFGTPFLRRQMKGNRLSGDGRTGPSVPYTIVDRICSRLLQTEP
jgi:hypothetical protein